MDVFESQLFDKNFNDYKFNVSSHPDCVKALCELVDKDPICFIIICNRYDQPHGLRIDYAIFSRSYVVLLSHFNQQHSSPYHVTLRDFPKRHDMDISTLFCIKHFQLAVSTNQGFGNVWDFDVTKYRLLKNSKKLIDKTELSVMNEKNELLNNENKRLMSEIQSLERRKPKTLINVDDLMDVNKGLRKQIQELEIRIRNYKLFENNFQAICNENDKLKDEIERLRQENESLKLTQKWMSC